MSTNQLWFADSEWGYRDDRVGQESALVPVVFCCYALETRVLRVFQGTGGELLRRFFDEHCGDTFVAHNAIAEMKYLLRAGVEPPTNWYDTYAAERLLTNGKTRLHAGLAESLTRLGKPLLAPENKESLRNEILHLKFNPKADMKRIVDYCLSDCDACEVLWRLQDEEE